MINQKVDMEEKLDVVNKFTKNLKTSGYNRNQCMELVTSGVRGFMNKQVNRKKNGEEFYRSAKKTMGKRIHKKLTEKTNWYRKKKENDTERNFVGLNANGLPSWRRYHG